SEALGRRGQRLGAGLPSNLGSDQKPAGAEEVGTALTALVHAVRGQIEAARGGGKAAVEELEKASDGVRALELDLSGARRALEVVARSGLSEQAGSSGSAGPRRTRDEWLAAIYAQLSRRVEGDVRVHAMLALGRLSGAGFQSLREEDWQAWWNAHKAPRDPS